MHTRLFLGVVLASLAWGNLSWGAVIINFDESGHGTVTAPGVGTVPLISFGKGVDPVDPANGLLPLIYNVSGTPGVGAAPFFGDIEVREPQAPNVVSDLLRFTNQGLLVVYSLVEPNPALADVGIPVLRQPNLLLQTETVLGDGSSGLFNYMPVTPQPGALPTDQAIYNFTSDTPEPGALALLGLAIAPVAFQRRR